MDVKLELGTSCHSSSGVSVVAHAASGSSEGADVVDVVTGESVS